MVRTGFLIFVLACHSPAAMRVSHVLWRNPGRVSRLDFRYGPGGRALLPRPPFRFQSEDSGGYSPKVIVRDAAGRTWSVKWGPEAKAEAFAVRLVWAAGYFAEPTYLIRNGRILGVRDAGRARSYIGPRGEFRDARFELRTRNPRYLQGRNWRWDQNPFLGRQEFQGLKILTMLLSNWDNKHANTGVYRAVSRRGVEYRYLITDWGASLGGWGGYFTRDKWDCDEFSEQDDDFVKGLQAGSVSFGFNGQRTGIREAIRPSDVRWMMRYLGHITDGQLRTGLQASGADAHQVRCFSRALRRRINTLKTIR
jgi:hypothetical protein